VRAKPAGVEMETEKPIIAELAKKLNVTETISVG